jgi:hypothetical protein
MQQIKQKHGNLKKTSGLSALRALRARSELGVSAQGVDLPAV